MAPATPAVDVKSLHAKIGELTLENDFLEGALTKAGAERKAMIDREHDLSITKQAEILQISRGSVYYLPRPVPDADLAIQQFLRRDRTYPGPLETPNHSALSVDSPAHVFNFTSEVFKGWHARHEQNKYDFQR